MEALPPLPKSLTITSGEQSMEELVANEGQFDEQNVVNVGNNRLDEKLSILRKEMIGLRQLDMSLLSQLKALQESLLSCKRMFDLIDSEHNESHNYENCDQFEAICRLNSTQSQPNSDNEDEDQEEDNDKSSEASDECAEDSTESSNSNI